MWNPDHSWGIVLAAGSGRRLRPLTTDAGGTVIPKQFCTLAGGPSLLRSTIERIQEVVAPGRVVVVVAAEHRRWWEPELSDVDSRDIIVQPCDRGTACGVLLPLMSILHRDPEARVLVSPSDNYIHDLRTFNKSLMTAQAHVADRPHHLVLLGMEPDRPETDYGWITSVAAGDSSIQQIRSFVEKPDNERARHLFANGALWSSFTFVTTAKTLMVMFRNAVPWLVERFTFALEFDDWQGPHTSALRLYDKLPTVDFSRKILQECVDHVRVLPVPPCGWTDLGTPERLAEWARAVGCRVAMEDCPDNRKPVVDLSRAIADQLEADTAPIDIARLDTQPIEIQPAARE